MRIFEIAREYCGTRYCLWENVPGAFSSNNGLDFAYVLGSMVGGSIHVPFDGWKNSGVAVSGNGRRLVEWRVLDAQNFGVPQRRRRIFALLDTGAWWSREPILFEQEGMLWDSAKSRVEGEGTAEGAGKCFTSSSFGGYQAGVGTLRSNGGDLGGDLGGGSETIIYENHANDSRVTRCDDGIVPTLSSRMGTGGSNVPFVLEPNTVVRRLTPVECERLQGFPDNYTNIPWANKATAPDSRRYKALGNSMAVPVMLWIGKRIEGAREVVYDEEAIRKVMLPPLSDDEIKHGQQTLF